MVRQRRRLLLARGSVVGRRLATRAAKEPRETFRVYASRGTVQRVSCLSRNVTRWCSASDVPASLSLPQLERRRPRARARADDPRSLAAHAAARVAQVAGGDRERQERSEPRREARQPAAAAADGARDRRRRGRVPTVGRDRRAPHVGGSAAARRDRAVDAHAARGVARVTEARARRRVLAHQAHREAPIRRQRRDCRCAPRGAHAGERKTRCGSLSLSLSLYLSLSLSLSRFLSLE